MSSLKTQSSWHTVAKPPLSQVFRATEQCLKAAVRHATSLLGLPPPCCPSHYPNPRWCLPRGTFGKSWSKRTCIDMHQRSKPHAPYTTARAPQLTQPVSSLRGMQPSHHPAGDQRHRWWCSLGSCPSLLLGVFAVGGSRPCCHHRPRSLWVAKPSLFLWLISAWLKTPQFFHYFVTKVSQYHHPLGLHTEIWNLVGHQALHSTCL